MLRNKNENRQKLKLSSQLQLKQWNHQKQLARMRRPYPAQFIIKTISNQFWNRKRRLFLFEAVDISNDSHQDQSRQTDKLMLVMVFWLMSASSILYTILYEGLNRISPISSFMMRSIRREGGPPPPHNSPRSTSSLELIRTSRVALLILYIFTKQFKSQSAQAKPTPKVRSQSNFPSRATSVTGQFE